MQLIRKFALAATMVTMGTGAFAQNADDIISKNIQAMGGKDKLTSLVSVYEENTTSVMGNDFNSKIWILNGKGFRVEVEVMGSTVITAITKDTGWTVNPMTGNSDPQPLTADQVKQSSSRLDIRGQFLDYAARGYTAALLGNEKLNGKDNYKIKLSKTGEGDQVYYVDAATYYVNKVTVTTTTNGETTNTDLVLADYRKTPEGFVFPYLTTINNPSSPTGEVKSTLTKVVPNQTVDPKIFDKP